MSADAVGSGGGWTTPEVNHLLATETERLARLAAAILGDRNHAEDAVQNTLLAAWRSWTAVRDEDKRQAWLTTICVRECLRVRRSLIRNRASALPDHSVSTPASDDLEWDRAFAKLSPRQRVVIVLHYLYGYTLDESARLMRCRPGTARQHLARGLRHLRREISHD